MLLLAGGLVLCCFDAGFPFCLRPYITRFRCWPCTMRAGRLAWAADRYSLQTCVLRRNQIRLVLLKSCFRGRNCVAPLTSHFQNRHVEAAVSQF
jgi:hypothetical protein